MHQAWKGKRIQTVFGLCGVDKVEEGSGICCAVYIFLLPRSVCSVFAKTILTPSAWIRIIFCQGPRQVLNALTLYSVYTLKLNPDHASDVGSFLSTFFKNISLLAKDSNQQAVVLSGMVFTLVIWIFGALSLFLALLFWLFFLWHYIPNADGSLGRYCERKVDKRLSRIVSVKVNKAIAKEEERRLRADAKAVKKGEKPTVGRQATLPVLFDNKSQDKLPQMPMLNRNDTMTTLPLYSSRPGTPNGQPPMPALELDQLDQKRPFPNRTVTGSSTTSNAPLLGNASDMGYGRAASPAPSLPSVDGNGYPSGPLRSMTGNTNVAPFRGPPGGPPRMASAMADRAYTQSPMSYTDGRGTPVSQTSTNTFGQPMPRAVGDLRSNTPAGPAPSMGRRTPFDPYAANGGRSSPAPSQDPRQRTPFDPYAGGRSSPAPAPASEYGRSSPAPPQTPTTGGYQAYNPNMRSASAAPTSNPGPQPPYRNMTDPSGPSPRGPPQGDYFSNGPPRPGTGQSQRQGPARLASPAPYNGGSPGFGPVSGNGGMDSPGYRRS